MFFSEPLFLWLLLPLALFLFAAILVASREASPQSDALARFWAHASGSPIAAMPAFFERVRLVSRVLALMAFASIVVALAGPSAGERLVPARRSGLDIAIALDLSGSMDCEDVAPSRLEAAKDWVRELAVGLEGVRFSLVVGKGEALVVQPLSDDRESLLAILDGLGTQSFAASGSDLEALLDTALQSLPPTSSGRPMVILLSDGEAVSGVFTAAAERAGRSGVIVHSVGFGTESGAPVPARGEGPLHISRRNGPALKAVATLTGGQYHDGQDLSSRQAFIAQTGREGASSYSEFWRREPVERHSLFVALAIVLLVASRLYGYRRPS